MWRMRLVVLLSSLLGIALGAVVTYLSIRHRFPGVDASYLGTLLGFSGLGAWVVSCIGYVVALVGREATAQVTVLVHDEEGGEHSTMTTVRVWGRWVGPHKKRRFIITDTRDDHQ